MNADPPDPRRPQGASFNVWAVAAVAAVMAGWVGVVLMATSSNMHSDRAALGLVLLFVGPPAAALVTHGIADLIRSCRR